MFKAIFSMIFWVVVARWGYSELQLSFPNLVPFIDYSLSRVQIPTHDKWPAKATVISFLNTVAKDWESTKAEQASNSRPVHPHTKLFGASLNQSDSQVSDYKAQVRF